MIDTDTLHLQWALSYPFPRPQTPFIFLDGATWPLMQTQGGFGDWIIDHAKGPIKMAKALGEQRLSEFERGAYHAVAAVGSNAAPAQFLNAAEVKLPGGARFLSMEAE